MKRKLLFFLAMMALLVCIFAISVSAETLTNYASVKLTLVDGTEAVGYCEVDGRFQRDNVYINPENTDDGTYAWENIKVFDMRDSVIVGTNTYSEVGGLNCNSQAVNVEEYYFSSQVTKILNTTFTSGWKNLKKVYIPKTVTTIDSDSFKQSPVEQVVFEEDSQLRTIGANAFRECANLSTFTFPEGLESLGLNCFFNAGLSGTIVIPNSVTFLGAGSLLSTKIENLYLGDGVLEIGYNFAGTYEKIDNPYLENVYISASTTFTQANIFYKCANPVNFYVVGTKKECESMVATLKAQSTGNYMTFITADEVTEETGAGYGIIHTEYNRCDAFYNGEHLTAEQTYEFTSFTEKSYVKSVCTRCEQGTVLKEIAPIFTCLGYSYKIDTTNGGGIACGYTLDKTALDNYIKETGKEVNLGLIMFNANSDSAKNATTIFDKDKVVINEKIVQVEITDPKYSTVNLEIKGFTEENADISLVIALYINEKEAEDTYKTSFIQSATTKDGKNISNGEYNKEDGSLITLSYNSVIN